MSQCYTLLWQELVNRFNFHHYDNLMHTRLKLDPRKRQLESTGQEVVTLLCRADVLSILISESSCIEPPLKQFVAVVVDPLQDHRIEARKDH